VDDFSPAHARELQLLLEEYRALRDEITASLAAQHAALSYGVAAVALVTVALGTIWDKSPGLTGIALMTAVPLGLFFVFTVWGTEIGRMRRAGAYIAGYLEPRINDVSLVPNGLAWEAWLEGDLPSFPQFQRPRKARRRSLDIGIATIALLLALFAVTAFAVGAFHYNQAAETARKQVRQANLAVSAHVHHSPKRAAPFYYRWWHLWRGREFWGLVLGFLALPVFLGLAMTSLNTRLFRRHDLPGYATRQEQKAAPSR
jgi:hypothetical protein